ncbi:hypothetical protein EV361DRAFT_873536 [Lentinula raphanica]|nr:hypothetical protein EV361DRAFT_873536 [Lentinula raphanica]
MNKAYQSLPELTATPLFPKVSVQLDRKEIMPKLARTCTHKFGVNMHLEISELVQPVHVCKKLKYKHQISSTHAQSSSEPHDNSQSCRTMHYQYSQEALRAQMLGGFLVATAILCVMVVVFIVMRMLLVSWFKAKELKRREEKIARREIEMAREARTLQFDVNILVCERLAQILELSALSFQERAYELEIEKELADVTLQHEYESTD